MQEGATLFTILKCETKDLHRAIEASLPLLSPTLNVAEYRRHLQELFAFYRPLEAAIAEFLKGQSDAFSMYKRYKAPWLAEDLKSLSFESSSLPYRSAHPEIPQVSSMASLVGILYVIEGSTLGGQVIRRILKTKLGLDDSLMRFYIAYDGQTQENWNSFRNAAAALI
ncbi:MAG: biliverdin-producing heme oxygenase, partial [Proteobacteria bacterium]|nr:biliverdin-producing heme oxygenase [Pseudomonadota bacterium]